MKLLLSNRLRACCEFVRPGDRVADIGTDHGYLGIFLLQNGLASRIFASDVREKPLEKARENAKLYGVAEKMQCFLSDGAQRIPRDFDVLVCAGMGADTIIGILKDAPWLRSGAYRLILQPQSTGYDLRRYLSENGWQISQETLCQDGGFLYTVMEAIPGAQLLSPGEQYLSPALRQCGNELLKPYAARCIRGLADTLAGMERAKSDVPEARRAYFRQALEENRKWEEAYDKSQ